MAVSAVVSVASFTSVLAETFAAVGLSTIIPAGVVTVARMAKAAAANPGTSTAPSPETAALNKAGAAVDLTPAKAMGDLVKVVGESLTSLDLLLPKTAKIHAEFSYQGSDSASVNASVGGMVQVVTVNAGFSAMYSSTSSNKITLDVDFVSVNVIL